MSLLGAGRGAGVLALAALALLTLLVPGGLRAVDARFGVQGLPATYLPALEGPRSRGAFDPAPMQEIARIRASYVIVGDSMAGTRIHTTRFEELVGRPVGDVMQAGSGPVFWYLALKNWVIASGARPQVAFVFFRDTNLTDVMFRLDEDYRWNVDRVAGEREDEVNAAIAAAGGWRRRARSAVERSYGADRVRLWMPAALTDRLARSLVPGRERRARFLHEMNQRFDVWHVRPMDAADVSAPDDELADFDYYVNRSVLPLMLRDARAAGIRLCFVRVQRRPVGRRPPAQSKALQTYVAKLRDYVVSHGAIWRDDTGDPDLTIDMYADGDHLMTSARPRYTEILFQRVRPSLQ